MDEKKYKHAEAFCLMQYRDEVTGEIETLWNSRDGVTPFVIESRAGNEAQHVNWPQDKRSPDFAPTPGMRVFVDASPEQPHIRNSARDYVEKYWNLDIGGGQTMKNTLHKASGAEMTKGQAIAFFIAEWTKPGSPAIVEIPKKNVRDGEGENMQDKNTEMPAGEIAPEAMREMPKYKCHKEVWALKIAEITYQRGSASEESDGSAMITPAEEGYAPFRVDHAYVRKHKPAIGGYYVRYADGYESFSPAAAFEEGYARI